MSIFGKIKDAIFGHDSASASQPAQPSRQSPAMPQVQATATQPQQPVDVEATLRDIAAKKSNPKLNYDSSIVDLMKLLDIDSSLSNREQLATELGYTGTKDGSAEMNIWLHKAVMQELAKNGGKVPATLTD